MVPKISKAQAERAKAAGARVVKKPRPAPQKTPIPETQVQPVMPDLGAVERAVEAMKASVEQQEKKSEQHEKAATQQAEELSRLIATLGMPAEPVRLRVHRDMERASPTYLLIQYIDVIPVQAVERKLNS